MRNRNVDGPVGYASAAPAGISWPLILDIAERALVLVAGAWLVYRFIPTLDAHPFGRLLLLSEGLIVLFIVVRRTGPAVDTVNAWLLALVGTFGPMLIHPVGQQLIPAALGEGMMLTGLLFSISAKTFLQRSFGIVAANRGVKHEGPYRLVRHPMYLGYLFSNAAFLGMTFSAWNLLIYAACWTAMILRISAEEGILEQDERYVAYRANVRWKLIPGVW